MTIEEKKESVLEKDINTEFARIAEEHALKKNLHNECFRNFSRLPECLREEYIGWTGSISNSEIDLEYYGLDEKFNNNTRKDIVINEILNPVFTERYIFTGILGRGDWGMVYSAYDSELNQRVAIKLFKPSKKARELMAYRNINPIGSIRNEAEEFRTCRNVVPRKIEIESNPSEECGERFIVMPFYKKFFSQILEEAKKRKKETIHSFFNGEEQTAFGSRLFMNEISKYASDIANGINEIHTKFGEIDTETNRCSGKVHCDIKPDNIAAEENNTLLISDLGTSTCGSFGMTLSARDHMGWMYIRPPALFQKEAHPKKKDDVFAFGSLLYMMFTGEYIFQEEIDNALAEGGEENVQEFMDSLVEIDDYVFLNMKNISYSNNAKDKVKTKIKNQYVPEEFKRLIKDSVLGMIDNGGILKSRLEECISQYQENRTKKRHFDEFKKDLKKNAAGALTLGTAIGALVIGVSWLSFIGAGPDHSLRTDMEAQVEIREYVKSEVVLECEMKYSPQKPVSSRLDQYDALLSYHKRFSEDTVVNRIIEQWIQTGNDLGGDIEYLPGDIRLRYVRLYGGSMDSHTNASFSDFLKPLISQYLQLNENEKNVIDIEDALSRCYLGSERFMDVQKAANSLDFRNYIEAKDNNGDNMINEKGRRFLKHLLYRIQTNMGDHIRIETKKTGNQEYDSAAAVLSGIRNRN